MTRRILVAASGALVLSLSACGGSDGGSTTSSTTSPDVRAQDATAEATARTAQTVVEVYATEHNGSYAGVDTHWLERIEPTLRGATIDVSGDASSYSVSVDSESGTTFTVARVPSGVTRFSCSDPGTGNCPPGGDWAGG